MGSDRNEPAPGGPPPRAVSISYRVPYADTDQMGVVYYANYLVYFERLRNELLRRTSLTYKEWETRGLKLPVVRAYCRYLAPARYDDLIAIAGWVASAGGVKLRIDYRVARDDNLLAEGYTVHACLSAAGRPVRLPDEFKSLAAGEGHDAG